MPTSGTRTFKPTRDSIVQAAYRKIGVEAPSVAEAKYGVDALNSMVMGWQAEGVFLWETISKSQLLTIGLGTYTITEEYVDVDNMYLHRANGNMDYPMSEKSREDFANISLKSDKGIPNIFNIQYLIGSTVIQMYYTPDAADTIYFDATRKLQDFDPANNTDADFPTNWSDALIWGLAVRLAPEKNITLPERQLLQKESQYFYGLAIGTTREHGDMQIIPYRRAMR